MLRFLIDVNIGRAVAGTLRDAGHDVTFAGDVDWRMPDENMLSLAHGEQRIMLTMDTDFGELVYHSQQSHAGVLLLRMPGANRDEKIRVVQEIVGRYGDQLPGRFAYTGRAGFAFVLELHCVLRDRFRVKGRCSWTYSSNSFLESLPSL